MGVGGRIQAGAAMIDRRASASQHLAAGAYLQLLLRMGVRVRPWTIRPSSELESNVIAARSE
jgi:hypothetical protein